MIYKCFQNHTVERQELTKDEKLVGVKCLECGNGMYPPLADIDYSKIPKRGLPGPVDGAKGYDHLKSNTTVIRDEDVTLCAHKKIKRQYDASNCLVREICESCKEVTWGKKYPENNEFGEKFVYAPPKRKRKHHIEDDFWG